MEGVEVWRMGQDTSLDASRYIDEPVISSARDRILQEEPKKHA